MKVKRISFKYLEDENKYIVLKVQNVTGFRPKQKISPAEVDTLESTEIEVIRK